MLHHRASKLIYSESFSLEYPRKQSFLDSDFIVYNQEPFLGTPWPQPCTSCAGIPVDAYLAVLIWVTGCALSLCLFLCVCETPEDRGEPQLRLVPGPAHRLCGTLRTAMFKIDLVFHEAHMLWQDPGLVLLGLSPASSALECACDNQHLNPSFIQQVFIRHLLYARDCSQARAYSSEQNNKNPVLLELMCKWREVIYSVNRINW